MGEQDLAREHEELMLERAARGFEAAATLIDDAVEELGAAAKVLVAGGHGFSLDEMSVLKTCQELAAQQARAVRQQMEQNPSGPKLFSGLRERLAEEVGEERLIAARDQAAAEHDAAQPSSADLVCVPLSFLEHVLVVIKNPEARRQDAYALIDRLEAFLGDDQPRCPPAASSTFEIKPDVRVDRYVGGRCPSCGRGRLELYVDGTETGVTVPRAVGVRCEKCFTTWILDPALATVYGDHDDRCPLRPAHDNDYGLGA